MSSAGESAASREALDELALLASVEHSLCVEYLLIHCALGHELPPADGTEVAGRVSEAAAAASALAQSEMRHLHNLNRLLSAAARPPALHRAATITTDGGPDIALVPANPAASDLFLDRLSSIAAAIDARYARLLQVVSSRPPVFEELVLEQMLFVLDPAPDHVAALAALKEALTGLTPAQFLRVTRVEPDSPLEHRLRSVSDAAYQLIVLALDAWFAHEEELGGDLRGRAITLMEVLDDVNGLLVQRGLLPALTPPDVAR